MSARAQDTARSSGLLAQLLQEALTAVVRLRGNRQTATSAESFRNQLKQLLSTAHSEARRSGYSDTNVKLSIYGVVVLLDESVLNSRNPVFGEWSRKPLQEELFGGHTGGEQFFDNLRSLLAQDDSEELADVLEVYQLCLLLGFQGRFAGSGGELERLAAKAGEKVSRIRGGYGVFAPNGLPAKDEALPVRRDPWLRPLIVAAAVGVLAALVLLIAFNLYLDSWISGQMRSIGR